MPDRGRPTWFSWTGDAMVPRWARVAASRFVVGREYLLIEHFDRSDVSHRHMFACIHAAWQNLPEDETDRFPTPEHLRKFALIRTGWRDERAIVVETEAEAHRLAAYIQPLDDYWVVIVKGHTVWVLTAKSQAADAMNRADFQASKEAILDLLAPMIGVTRAELDRNAEEPA